MSREGPPKVTAGHEFPWAWAALWRRSRAVCCAATPQKGLAVEQELQKVTSAARLGGAWTPRELRHSFVSILSAHDVWLEDISDLVGHSSTSVTETVYRHEIRPALTDNAIAVNRTLKANATELARPCSGKAMAPPIGSRKLNLKTCLTSLDGGI